MDAISIKLRVICYGHMPAATTLVHEIDVETAARFLSEYSRHGGDEQGAECIETYLRNYLRVT
jgi:hypothetical protein